MSYMGKFSVGTFIPVDSPIHRLDPRVKIVSVLILLVLLFLTNSIVKFIPYIFLTAFLFYLSRLPLKVLIKGIKPVLFLLSFAFVFQIFFTPGEIIFKLSFISVTKEGLNLATVNNSEIVSFLSF